jgi:hypothetical protein
MFKPTLLGSLTVVDWSDVPDVTYALHDISHIFPEITWGII